MHLCKFATDAVRSVLTIARQRLQLPRREVQAFNHALLNHVDNDLEAHVAEAAMQQVEGVHVRVIGSCECCAVGFCFIRPR
jgi:hypothetical protein